jgi:hypothetical protein
VSNHGNSGATHSRSHSTTRRKFYKADICLGIQLKLGLFENSSIRLCSLQRFNDHNSDVVPLHFGDRSSTVVKVLATNPMVAGSILDGVIGFFH